MRAYAFEHRSNMLHVLEPVEHIVLFTLKGVVTEEVLFAHRRLSLRPVPAAAVYHMPRLAACPKAGCTLSDQAGKGRGLRQPGRPEPEPAVAVRRLPLLGGVTRARRPRLVAMPRCLAGIAACASGELGREVAAGHGLSGTTHSGDVPECRGHLFPKSPVRAI